jgi:hypothetical protein
MLQNAKRSPRQQDAFAKKLAEEAPAAGPNSRADGHLSLSSGGAGQKQIGNVRTGDQQNQTYGPQEHKQRPANRTSDPLLVQRRDVGANAAVGQGILSFQPASDGLLISVLAISREIPLFIRAKA